MILDELLVSTQISLVGGDKVPRSQGHGRHNAHLSGSPRIPKIESHKGVGGRHFPWDVSNPGDPEQ